MIYLVIAILSSASFALVLKLFSTQEGNRYGIILGNYITCVCLAAFLMPEKHLILSPEPTTLACGVFTGIIFVLGLVIYQQSIQKNGASLSAAFGRLGIVVSLSISIFIFKETPTVLQLSGIALVVVAILLINRSERGDPDIPVHLSLGLLVGTLLSNGLADGMAKVFEEIGSRSEDVLYFFYLFLVAGIISMGLAYREYKVNTKPMTFPGLCAGLIAGIPNYFSSYLLLKALTSIPAFVVYSLYSTITIVLVSLVSFLVFKERLGKHTWAAMGIILVALILLQA